MHTRRRIFLFAVDADIASREGVERRTVAKQLNKRDMYQKPIWTTCSRSTKRKEEETQAFVVVRERESDESSAQRSGSEEVDWRLDVSKADGTAS